MVGIYEILNKDNGKRYIGQSNNILDRLNHHRSELRNNRHRNLYLQSSWNYHGEDAFEFNPIEECTKDKLNAREIYWINHYNTYVGFDNSTGYNLTPGGDTKFETYHPILQFDLYGNYVNEFDNGFRASEVTGINVSSIYGCATKKLKRAGRYIWIYKEDYKDNNSLEWYLTDRRLEPVEQYDLSGNLIRIWDSVSQIINETGNNPINCLIHNAKTYKGYIYKYISDPLELTEEYFLDIQEKHKNRKNKEFAQVDINGNAIKIYSSIREAERDGWHERMISECLSGTRLSYKGYLWILLSKLDKYTPDICYKLLTQKKKAAVKPVVQYDLEGNFIREYNSLADTTKEGFNKSTIRDCCVGNKKQYKGFIWKYKDD